MKIVKKLIAIKELEDYYEILTNSIGLRIWFVTEDIVRIRAGFDEDFIEESYSLVKTAWDDRMDEFFGDAREKIKVSPSQLEEKEKCFLIKGQKLKVEINKEPFRITIYNDKNEVIHRDLNDLAYMEDNNLRRTHSSEIEADDYFYGFGEKTGMLNKAGTRMSMYPVDAMGYNPKQQDSLYKHIPFYIKLNKNTKNGVGYFYHNTYSAEFDMGREHSNYWHKKSRYRTDGGDIDLFIINGPKIRDVVERYTDLTGKSTLLPKYGLGYLGSSMYYAEQDEDADDAIVSFIKTSKKEGIPIDGFQLSSGYNNIEIDGKMSRSVFNWNYKRFKDPKKFFQEMTEHNVVVSPNVKPGMLLTNPLYEEMKEKNMYVKDKEGNPGVASWWGGDGVYIDFTNVDNRQQWKKYLKDTVIKQGTFSVWNDNAEYDGIVNEDYMVDFEGRPTTIQETRSVMPNLMCHSTKEAILEVDSSVRPFIVCRSGHAGIQRYAQTWAGDNYTSWDSLQYNIATILGMGLSGVANNGTDIGGFSGPAPEPELLLRWVQHGIFQPRFSIHSTNTDNTVTEPWMYEEYTPLIREAIQFRYQLSPYLYSLAERANRIGLPIMEPLVSAFQDDHRVYEEGVNFMLGDSLFVANVVEKGCKEKEIYFPKDTVFYDFFTRESYEGGQTIKYPVDFRTIPLFIKSGGIIPIADNKIENLTASKLEKLKLICVPDRDSSFVLYEDDGVTNAYLEGEYLRTYINLKAGETTKIEFNKEGDYDTTIKEVYLDVVHHKNAPFKVTVDKKELSQYLYKKDFTNAREGWHYDQTLKSVQIKYQNVKGNYTVEIDFTEIDIIGM